MVVDAGLMPAVPLAGAAVAGRIDVEHVFRAAYGGLMNTHLKEL